MHLELARIRELAKVHADIPAGSHDRLARLLVEVLELATVAAPCLALFLSHPTRRAADWLLCASHEACMAVAGLAQTPPQNASPELLRNYGECCERLQSSISDWRLAVELKCAEVSLECQPRETLQ